MEIVTERLVLFPFGEKFLTAKYVSWLNDAEVVKFSEQRHFRHTLETCKQYAASFKDSQNMLWAITKKSETSTTGLNHHIGNISAAINAKNSVADVAILIGEKECWGQGLGLEAWTAVCDYLLTVKNLRKITAGAMSDNKGMVSIMKKSGMTEEGLKARQFLRDGHEVDGVYFALFGKS